MANQFGNAAVGSSSMFFSLVNTLNQNATFFPNWPGGTVTDINVNFAGHGGTINARLCIWDHSGVLLQQTGDISVASGSGTIGGQAWHTVSGLSWTIPADATGLYIGFWRTATQSNEFTLTASGTTVRQTNTSGSPNNFSSPGSITGKMGAYVTYTSGGIPVWNGTTFVKRPTYVWNGTTWVWRPVYFWTGTTWQRIG